jgi:hypothetical protein
MNLTRAEDFTTMTRMPQLHRPDRRCIQPLAASLLAFAVVADLTPDQYQVLHRLHQCRSLAQIAGVHYNK